MYAFGLPRFALCTLLALTFSHASESRLDIVRELGPLLDQNARIITPEAPDFEEASLRWDSRSRLGSRAIVEVASEEDIIRVIQYANQHSTPFIALNGGHGSTEALSKFHDGIVISMKHLDRVEVDDNTAIVEGGVTSGGLVTALWSSGKQAVQGLAECTGFMGPALGGGHSVLQGRLGLMVDQFLEARVILANGSVVTTSETKHEDLFWAMRGAGHNFGIVSQIKIKVFDVDVMDTWYYETLVYRHDQFEALMEEIFSLSENQPERLNFAAVIARVPAVDPVNAVILFNVLYDGLAADADPYVQSFRDLQPIPFQDGTVSYVHLASVLGQGLKDNTCRCDDRRRLRYPVYMTNPDDIRAVKDAYDIYNATTFQQPGFNTSVVLIEGVGRTAVTKVPLESTAVPLRDHGVIIFPVVEYSDTTLDQAAFEFGEAIRSSFKKVNEGAKQLQVYVNYASGNETSEEIYGHEAWRLQKLRRLKAEYDPKNAFRWYVPIEPAERQLHDEL